MCLVCRLSGGRVRCFAHQRRAQTNCCFKECFLDDNAEKEQSKDEEQKTEGQLHKHNWCAI